MILITDVFICSLFSLFLKNDCTAVDQDKHALMFSDDVCVSDYDFMSHL